MKTHAAPFTALILATAALAAACTVEPDGPVQVRRPKPNWEDYEEDPGTFQPIVKPEPPAPAYIDDDSGAFVIAGERPADEDAQAPDDGGVGDASGPKTYCETPIVKGSLAIVEILVSSRSGAGDKGEWVEIKSARDCWLKLDGIEVESPRGAAAANVAKVPAGSEIPPFGSFVAASSGDPLDNHGITGVVAPFDAADVLKNDGDTVRVKLGALVVDELTYPRFSNLTPGRSLAFPSNCKATDRGDFARWSLTFRDYATGFKGTPNGPNNDVTCF